MIRSMDPRTIRTPRDPDQCVRINPAKNVNDVLRREPEYRLDWFTCLLAVIALAGVVLLALAGGP